MREDSSDKQTDTHTQTHRHKHRHTHRQSTHVVGPAVLVVWRLAEVARVPTHHCVLFGGVEGLGCVCECVATHPIPSPPLTSHISSTHSPAAISVCAVSSGETSWPSLWWLYEPHS